MFNAQHIHDALFGNQYKLGIISLGRILRHARSPTIIYKGQERSIPKIKSTYTQSCLELISYLSSLNTIPTVHYKTGLISIPEYSSFNQVVKWDGRINEDPSPDQRLVGSVLTASTVQVISGMSTGIEQRAMAGYHLADTFNSQGSYPLEPTNQSLHVLAGSVLLGNPKNPYSQKDSLDFLINLEKQGMIELERSYNRN